MNFWKMNGAGNDFIIINNIEEKIPAENFKEIGADFTIKTMEELPELVERINKMLSEGKMPNGK